MGEALHGNGKSPGRLTRLEAGLVGAISAPFWAAAVKLGWDALNLPAKSGRIAWVQLWEASVFSLGLAVGLVGAALALGAVRRRCRSLGLSLVLMGTACIAFAFVMGACLEGQAIGAQAHVLPFAIPALLLFVALAALLDSLRTVEKTIGDTQEPEPISEQQLPLSRP